MTDTGFDRPAWTASLFRNHERRHRHDGERGADFDDWQAAFRRDLRETLGLPVVRQAGVPDPDPRRHGAERAGDHERQTWSVRTETDVRVPFYVLVPDGVEPPYPVVFALHGHTPAGKDLPVGNVDAAEEAVVEEGRDFARQAVERGYAAVAPDVRGFGDLSEAEGWRGGTGTCGRLQMHAQLFGRSLLGDRVWDLRRIADFVADRPAFDADRMAITGHSGGGAVTLFAAALDERFSPVVPSSYFCTFRDSILAVDHCECNYAPGVLELGEMADVAGLVAPRPFRALSGAEDSIFPVEGARESFGRLERIYGAAGAGEDCELYVGDGGHEYYPDGAWPFVDRHL